jgi:predicted DCC family thiol-disulfide oxidoreductase YuxK
VEVTRPTLIYDGDCGFCTSSATWVSRHWTGAASPVAVPWQELSVERVAELELDRDDFARSAWWIDGNRVDGGSRAIARALQATHGPWVAPLGYRVVAHHRHRLPGGTPACKP